MAHNGKTRRPHQYHADLPAVDGVVRWRRIDLKKVIEERFGVAYHERHVSTLLKRLGFSHVSARPRHPAQDAKIVEAFKKTFHAP